MVFRRPFIDAHTSRQLDGIILGAVAIVIILIAPNGIMGTLHERFGFEILSPRRKIKDMVRVKRIK